MAAESIGLFWLWAEALILWYVHRAARRLAAPGPLPPALLDAHDLRRLRCWSLWFALVSMVLVSRYVVAIVAVLGANGEPVSRAEPALESLVVSFELQFAAVWASLVTGWAVLELAIVWRGIAAFRCLRLRLAERDS